MHTRGIQAGDAVGESGTHLRQNAHPAAPMSTASAGSTPAKVEPSSICKKSPARICITAHFGSGFPTAFRPETWPKDDEIAEGGPRTAPQRSRLRTALLRARQQNVTLQRDSRKPLRRRLTTDGSVLSQESRVLEHRQGVAAQVRLAVSVQGEDGPCERLDPSTPCKIVWDVGVESTEGEGVE